MALVDLGADEAVGTPHVAHVASMHAPREDVSEPALFAVYRFRANRPATAKRASGERDGTAATENVKEDSAATDREDAVVADTSSAVAQFLCAEETRNDDFSLSVVRNNLPSSELEQTVRAHLCSRLARGCVYSGSGNVTQITRGTDEKVAADLLSSPAEKHLLCYYCVLRDDSEAELVDASDDGQAQPTICSSDFVVCFLREFDSPDVEFDLFRTEMDTLCTSTVLPLLSSCPADPTESSTDNDPLFATLASWYDVCVEYLPRCATFFGEQLAIVIHSALIGRKIDITGGTARQMRDIRAFVQALSLTSLLDLSAGAYHCENAALEIPDASIELSSDGQGFSISPMLETPSFCIEWAKAMRSACPDAVALKQAIHKHELHIIQDINVMKRFICQAESNHYALYNAYAFLCSCETVSEVVLASVLATTGDSPRSETKDVLEVLVAHYRKTQKQQQQRDDVLQ